MNKEYYTFLIYNDTRDRYLSRDNMVLCIAKRQSRAHGEWLAIE